MLERVCCIIDVDGFDIRKYDESWHSYTTEFLVRELGYIRIDPKYDYIPNSYRFDLRREVDPARCSPPVKRTLAYQSRNIVGLTVFPGPNEPDAVDYKSLNKVLLDIYDFCRRSDADVVAYKGGDKERNLLQALNILSVDLQFFGCPSYTDLVETGKVYSQLRDCGRHTEFRGNSAMHCPKAEVTAYRDWFMMNYKAYSTSALESL